jgi:hypothetical protein
MQRIYYIHPDHEYAYGCVRAPLAILRTCRSLEALLHQAAKKRLAWRVAPKGKNAPPLHLLAAWGQWTRTFPIGVPPYHGARWKRDHTETIIQAT